MNSFNTLWTPEAPWVHVTSDGAKVFISGLLPPSGTVLAGRLDGTRMRDSQGVFEEFSRELRFPAYFGWNWDALSDCLRDLSWSPACYVIIAISSAEEILLDEPEDRATFFRIMTRTGKSWANSVGLADEWGGGEVPFNTVLLCDTQAVQRLQEEVSATGS